ncbi:MAG: NupC/NupG family nucleoside CNT transporter [Deltaproteobacteria bacterium]|nr:NupC/NupG family nucleoside CNT transporter [Deltaproteobacteria bacterium]
MEKLISFIGLFIFILIAWAVSEKRSSIDKRLVLWGVALQFAFALLILKTALGHLLFDAARVVTTNLLEFTAIGATFLFGKLATDFSLGAVIAFKVLPTIIFVASLMGVLYYLRVIQIIVRGMAWTMERTMRASGAEAFIAASFVFMGIEAITAIKDYLKRMTRSEVFTLMTCFMATIAGSVMTAYVAFGADAGHLLSASVMSAPAAIVISKIMIPETGKAITKDTLNITELEVSEDDGTPPHKRFISSDVNVIDAAANGATEGLKLALTIGAILLAFVSIIGMGDALLGYVGTSFEELTGYLFAPVAFIMGVPYAESFEVGKLLGIKVIFNEFISYQKMQGMTLSPHAKTIATYALCSFANFGSLAILIGGVGGIVPERKKEVATLGLKALLAGCIAGFMTATIAGIII